MAGKGTLAFKNGKWYLVVLITEGPKNYRRKWIPLKAKTESEAKKERNIIWAEREKEEWIEPKKITINDCYERWIKHLKSRTRPAGRRTIEEYERIYANHVKDALEHVLLQKLTAKQVRELIESKDSQFKARRTYDVLNAIINLAYQDGDTGIKENVCQRLKEKPKIEKREPRIWNLEECKAFLNIVKGNRYYGVFLMAMTTGMRIGEVLGIRWSDVDIENKVFMVNQKLELKEIGNPEIKVGDPKTKASKARLLMTEVLAEELKRIKKRQAEERPGYKEKNKDFDFIFTNTAGSPVILEDLRDREFNQAINNAEIRKIRIHDLRHSAATLLRGFGIDIKTIQRYLRHADLSATQIYTHDDDVEFLREATEKMNDALK
jgi:integrase